MSTEDDAKRNRRLRSRVKISVVGIILFAFLVWPLGPGGQFAFYLALSSFEAISTTEYAAAYSKAEFSNIEIGDCSECVLEKLGPPIQIYQLNTWQTWQYEEEDISLIVGDERMDVEDEQKRSV